jgi:hypothetical protein
LNSFPSSVFFMQVKCAIQIWYSEKRIYMEVL